MASLQNWIHVPDGNNYLESFADSKTGITTTYDDQGNVVSTRSLNDDEKADLEPLIIAETEWEATQV